VPASLHKQSEPDDDPRRRQLVVGLGILTLLVLIVPAFYIVWRFVPGVFGEWLGVIAGIISTPFLLEISFVILGLVIVVGLNHLRQKRDGDDFVFLEPINDPTTSPGMPDQSKFAIHGDRPLDEVEPSPIDKIDGALETGDHTHAADLLAEIGNEELKQTVGLNPCLHLGGENGKSDLAQRIESEIAAHRSE